MQILYTRMDVLLFQSRQHHHLILLQLHDEFPLKIQMALNIKVVDRVLESGLELKITFRVGYKM